VSVGSRSEKNRGFRGLLRRDWLYYKVVDANIFSNAGRDLITAELSVIMLIQLYKALGGGRQL
jgi:hypothetical protein